MKAVVGTFVESVAVYAVHLEKPIRKALAQNLKLSQTKCVELKKIYPKTDRTAVRAAARRPEGLKTPHSACVVTVEQSAHHRHVRGEA